MKKTDNPSPAASKTAHTVCMAAAHHCTHIHTTGVIRIRTSYNALQCCMYIHMYDVLPRLVGRVYTPALEQPL